MSDTLTLRAFVATAPTLRTTASGVPVTNFRVASTPRWYDQAAGVYREGDTNWYTVNAFRALAQNTVRSLRVGQPVIVTGRLKVKKWDRDENTTITNVEIDATTVGHDLTFGTALYERTVERRAHSEPGQNTQSGEHQADQQNSQPSQQNTGEYASYTERHSSANSDEHFFTPQNGVASSDAEFSDLVEPTEDNQKALYAMTH